MNKVVSLYLVAAVGALVTQAFARPAAPSFQTLSNKDGSSVTIRYFGDEHYHYAETSDGYLVMLDSAGNCVYVGEDGGPSGVIAKNVEDRTDKEKSFLNGLNQEAAHQKHEELRGGRFPEDSSLTQNLSKQNSSVGQTAVMAYNQDGVSVALNRPTPSRWTIGERRFPVLLIGTTDKAHGDSAKFADFLNKPGYSENRNIGSLRDYFLFVSDSLFDPHFDVYPINLNAALTDFGYDSSFQEGKFVAMGLDELAKRADFLANAKKYCSSGSNVDGFFFLFPGMEEDALKQSDLFWGHQFWMQSNGSSKNKWFPSAYKAGGYTFDAYVFIAQYADRSRNSKINKMGIFAHEFSHVMGLGDHYGRDENNRQIDGPSIYDIMSVGMYNGTSTDEGNAPMGYSAFEKESVGWLTLEELQADSVYSLKKLSKMQAYSVTNPMHSDEYYIVEYRPAESYDAYVPLLRGGNRQNGVYVWYIDYDKTIFVTKNNANGDVNHQRVAINAVLAANGYYANFTYVNRGGSTSVPGIYNIVLDGTDRVCFTTAKDKSLSECPEEVSSSSVESSSSVQSSSSEAVLESSSSEQVPPESSSSESVSAVIAGVVAPQVQYTFEGRLLHVQADVPGVKDVRLFDMQGHLLYSEKFSGSAVTLDLGGMSRGAFVMRLTAGNKTLAVKRLQ